MSATDLWGKRPGRRRIPPASPPEPGAPVARVLPDVAGLDKGFDYAVPAGAEGEVRAGTEVRVDLAGRRVGGWVLDARTAAAGGPALRTLARVRGWGPEPEVVELAGWAAWRWAGLRRSLLRTASPPGAVRRLPPPALRPPGAPAADTAGLLADLPALVTLRLPPASDPTPVVAGLAQRGPTLVVVASAARAAELAARLRRAGGDVALLPGGWAQARAGAAVVVGTRAAAWAPCPGLAAVAVVDGHDGALAQEQAPTWHAVGVAAERARRAGAPCVVLSACPTLDLIGAGPVRLVGRSAERRGWAALDVVDRRAEDPRSGLYSGRLAALLHTGKRVLCVLNRTGRARLLACGACGEVARCERCAAALAEDPSGEEPRGLVCPRCSLGRPAVCAACGSTALRRLRVGVTRAREELQALAGRHVGEVTAGSVILPDADIVVGTEAVLRRSGPRDGIGAVAFVDFDQELLAPRVRAGEEALALLALASRLVGGRAGRVLVQTRIPDHPVITAALLADPAVASAAEEPPRRALRLPPYAGVAVLSGPAAAGYVARLEALPGRPVEVAGPSGDGWLARAASPAALADALAAAPRPPGRLRVAVDPPRL